MSIVKKGIQALFMQKAWTGAFLGHDQDGKWQKLRSRTRSVHMKDVGVRDALPSTKQPAHRR